MKAIRFTLLITLGAALTLGSLTCGSSSSSTPPFVPPGLDLRVALGPNPMVPEPHQLVGATATGDWANYTGGTGTAKSLEIITDILAATNLSGGIVLNRSIPDELLLAIVLLAFDMGDIVADPSIDTSQACSDPVVGWDSNAGRSAMGLTDAVTGQLLGEGVLRDTLLPNSTDLSEVATLNCAIFASQSGVLKVTFGTAGDVNYGGILTGNENQTGTLDVQGLLLPPSNLPGSACGAGTDCRNVWMTIRTADFGSAADTITATGGLSSALSGFIFDYDINQTTPNLSGEELYLSFNLELNGNNVGVVMHMANGLAGVSTDFESAIVDANGALWGYARASDGSGDGSRILLVGDNGGWQSVCAFDTSAGPSDVASAYVFNAVTLSWTGGLDGQPGVAGVDDDGDTVVDDVGELGTVGSDDVDACNFTP